MNSTNYASTIIQLLDEVDHLYHKKHRDVVHKLDITKDQMWILRHLRKMRRHNEKGISIGKLAHIFRVAQNTMSERVTRLAEKDYIIRKQSQKDRRKYIIEISEKGLDLLKYVREEQKKQFGDEIINSMEQIKLEQLAKLLSELVASIKED